jgi:hypothetical protein
MPTSLRTKKMKTKEQIEKCLAHLVEIAPKIRQRDAFGGNNRAKIDGQIDILREWPRWRHSEDYAEDKDIEEDEDELLGEVQLAIDWIEERTVDDLETSWDDLVGE